MNTPEECTVCPGGLGVCTCPCHRPNAMGRGIHYMTSVRVGNTPEEQKDWKLRLKAIIGDLEVADDFLPDKETIMFLSLSDFVTELLSSVKKQKDEEMKEKLESLRSMVRARTEAESLEDIPKAAFNMGYNTKALELNEQIDSLLNQSEEKE